VPLLFSILAAWGGI
jgi:hypothetical protein